MALVKVGDVVRAHGIRGELVVSIAAAGLRDWEAADVAHLGPDAPPVVVEAARFHRGRWLVTLAGVGDRNAAEALRGREIFVKGGRRDPRGWWTDDWTGFAVVSDAGEDLGRVTEVIHTGANDVIVTTGAGPELLLPVIPDVILTVDTEQRRLTVHVLDGLRG